MRNRNYLFLLTGIVTIVLSGFAHGERDYQTEAHQTHKELLTLDTHIDTPMRMVNEGWHIAEEHATGGPTRPYNGILGHENAVLNPENRCLLERIDYHIGMIVWSDWQAHSGRHTNPLCGAKISLQ